ncbi:MAG: DHA2 family efflux MFS transporter permease subunit [Alphaproteobacteria bacterium]|nr:DHA2 family efflux MFS transporter permease subunit [Alphaproteobacteria bacterium]
MSTTTAEGGLFSISGRLWLILLMVQLANMLFGMTITIANVILPQVRGTMSATQDEISWVITLNLVATAIATPMTGWLAARLGWRNVMLWCIGGFTVASFLCGTANNLESLVVYRIGQGVFGAPIMPMGQAILLATFPRHLHPTALVLWGVGAVFGPVLGPVLATLMTEANDDWRGAFFIIVPPGVVALVIIWFALSEHNDSKPTYFDWTGFLALSVAILCAQLIFDRGQRLDWFDSQFIVLLAALGAIAFWIFVVHCLTAAHPFLDPALLRDRNFAVGILIAFVMGMLNFTSLVLFPSLLHDLRGYPDAAIGVLLAARGMGNWVAFLVIIPVARIAPRFAIAAGLGIQAYSAYEMSRFDINLTDFGIFWTHMLQGFGQSVTYTPMTIMAFSTLPKHQITEGSGVFTLMRNFGSSLFISITVLTLVHSTKVNYATLSEYLTPYNKLMVMPIWPDAWSMESTGGLLRLSNEVQRQAAMIGYINSFYLMACVAAAAMPLACLMRKPAPPQ